MELRKIESSEHLLTLAVFGDFNAQASKEAQLCIDDVLTDDNHPQIEIDLEHVDFMDTSGIGAIVYFYKRLIESDRNMSIKNVHGQPQKMMELLRIGQAIPLTTQTAELEL
ncbi:STAS domain-containing protein [Vibrio superstes]|uniref:Anti-anti-sigma regulatory factor n=1 Tax=Vibrio superstes NBRC 103154 TaxID=1219062 RepID=A0A511QQ15_9VIBR|nr:STAS domain-containing protein [Vibrio superstes]GEM79420.1 anti-anti-sigma regulatory factor [Vibrio superstes NBRC 103154]